MGLGGTPPEVVRLNRAEKLAPLLPKKLLRREWAGPTVQGWLQHKQVQSHICSRAGPGCKPASALQAKGSEHVAGRSP